MKVGPPCALITANTAKGATHRKEPKPDTEPAKAQPKATRRTTMFAFEDVRFGFEVTMYINNR